MKYLKQLFKQFNFLEECRKNNISIWQCPSFLFIVMGFLTITIMLGTYAITLKYNSPIIVIISVSSVTIITLIIGSFIIRTVEIVMSVNRMKTEFISIASHQLRAPLSSIRWSVGMLERKNDPKTRKEYVDLIKENNHRMIVLVNTLLDVSRIEQGRMIFTPVVTNLCKTVERTIRELLPLAKASNVQIDFQVVGKIPNIFIDENKIQIAIQNLINNAVKYTKGKGKVKVVLNQKGEKIVISVEDVGVGIPKREQGKIFSKFFRSDNIMRHQTIGSGLGLFIAKGIVEANCGDIYFKSITGEGTTFWMELPLKQKKQCKIKAWQLNY